MSNLIDIIWWISLEKAFQPIMLIVGTLLTNVHYSTEQIKMYDLGTPSGAFWFLLQTLICDKNLWLKWAHMILTYLEYILKKYSSFHYIRRNLMRKIYDLSKVLKIHSRKYGMYQKKAKTFYSQWIDTNQHNFTRRTFVWIS